MPQLWDGLDQAQRPQPAPDMWRAPYGVGSDAEMAGSPSGLGSLASGLYQYLGDLAKRNIGNAQTYSQTGEYNPAPAVEAAMLPMGTGAIAGVPMRAGDAVLGAGPIRAYHGSPHDFDVFDASKIGTGEGAQVYGHGLYFAENEGVAKSYRDALAGKSQLKTDSGIIDISNLKDPAQRIAANAIKDSSSPEHARMLIQSFAKVNKEYGPAALQEFDKLQAMNAKPNPGNMYEVNIHADPAQMLDWDKPLSQQSRKVSDLLYPGVNPSELDLGDLHNVLRTEAATKDLAQAGIPGIKYLDQGSRGAGAGSSNYVIFDPNSPLSKVDILRKYGIAGLAPMAAGFGFPSVQGSNEQRM